MASKYKGTYVLELARLTLIKKHNGKCQLCGKKAVDVHHLDKSKTNHDLSNLVIVCRKCHLSTYHKGHRVNTKLKELYGYTIHVLIAKLNVSRDTVYRWHQQGTLHSRIESSQLVTV